MQHYPGKKCKKNEENKPLFDKIKNLSQNRKMNATAKSNIHVSTTSNRDAMATKQFFWMMSSRVEQPVPGHETDLAGAHKPIAASHSKRLLWKHGALDKPKKRRKHKNLK